MTSFWILALIFSTMCTVQSGGDSATSRSFTVPAAHHPKENLSVDLGGSASLKCCFFGMKHKDIIWFKQQNKKQPQIIFRSFKTGQETFYSEYQSSRFKMKLSGSCFYMTISHVTLSDEAMYYCAPMIADGISLQVKGEHVTTASGTSKPALCDNSEIREPMLHENATNMNTQQKINSTVLGLGTALGVCVLVILYLTYFIIRRRKRDKVNTSLEDSPGRRQEHDAESLNYAALRFTKRKAKTEQKKPGFSEDCVYSRVK